MNIKLLLLSMNSTCANIFDNEIPRKSANKFELNDNIKLKIISGMPSIHSEMQVRDKMFHANL